MKISIKFNEAWLYAGGGIHASAVRSLVRRCSEVYRDGFSVESQNMGECVLSFPNADEQVLVSLRSILGELLPENDLRSVCSIRVLDAAENDDAVAAHIRELMSAGETPQNTARSAPGEPQPVAADEPESESALEKIEAMIGRDALKTLAREIALRANQVVTHGTQRFFFSQSYLFSADSGTGFSRAMELMEGLLFEKGLFPERHPHAELALPTPGKPETNELMGRLMGKLEKLLTSPRVVVLDISEWRGKTGSEEFKNLLMFLFRKNKACFLVFRLPYLGDKPLREIEDDLADVIAVRRVVLPPFDREQTLALADDLLRGYNLRMADDARPIVLSLIEREKDDGTFYGIHTIRKVLGQVVSAHEFDCAQRNADYGLITARSLWAMTEKTQNASTAASEKLAGMIGMETVSARVRETVNQILFARAHDMGERPSMHMVFTGNPGTGKTTVARIVGEILRERGVLRAGKFIECKANDLIGEYVGQTAPKTVAMCRSAYGSVLFIDEAYALCSSGRGNDFGREAVAALIAEMENHSDDLVVIFAGYPDEMENHSDDLVVIFAGYPDEMDELLNGNPGLRSRIPYTIRFPNYTREQLFDIFMRMSSVHFDHAEGFDEHAHEFFRTLPQSYMDDKRFGNGRFVRNLYERVWGKASMRDTTTKRISLTVEDFDAAAAEFDLVPSAHETAPIGF